MLEKLATYSRFMQKVKSLIFFICSLPFLLLNAQSSPLTSISFIQVTGGVIIIQAKLQPHTDTLQFIFDTGSSGISLDSATASFLGLKKENNGQLIRGIGGVREVPTIKNKSLVIGQYVTSPMDFYVNDYSALTSIYGVRIDGVIGYALLSRYIVCVDYEKQKMDWFLPGIFKYPHKGIILKPNLNRLPAHSFIVRDLYKKSVPLLLDIGAGLNLLFSKRFAEESGVLDSTRKTLITSGEGIGGQITMRLTILPFFRIGPYTFKKIPITIFEDPFNVTNYPHWGGLIGNDLLRRFNLVINYPQGEIHLKPNRFFVESFDYSYSGMDLYLIGGIVKVGFVAPNSPAFQTGIEVGDEIIAINKIVNGTLDAYKSELVHASKKLSLIYKRDGKLTTVSLKLIHIK